MSWLTNRQLQKMNFLRIGKEVYLSSKASFYNCQNISIGDHVRIDDFCVLSAGIGKINIGSYVHISVYSSLIGGGNITLEDYCGLSSRVSIYSSNDDYSGNFMTNPTVPSKFTNVNHADVKIGRHVIVGSGTVVLPGVTLEEGAAIGSLSLVVKNCESFGVYIGVPAKKIKNRNRKLLDLEKKLISAYDPLRS